MLEVEYQNVVKKLNINLGLFLYKTVNVLVENHQQCILEDFKKNVEFCDFFGIQKLK